MSPPERFSPAREQEDALRARVAAAFEDPQWQEHPLLDVLRDLFRHSEQQRIRLEKLVRISDGYHNVARSRSLSLIEAYDKQIQKLGKLARISDRYQQHLLELNQALKEASQRDELTGMGNRRYLVEFLKSESERVARGTSPYALSLLDVDWFKSINDRYGHDAGDRVLCRIAQAIERSLRDYDLCGRWGGEEFLVMLPETSLEAARQVCERVRESVGAVALGDFPELSVSASFGLVMHVRGESYSETVNRADAALLQAKAGGRNRVVVA